MHREFTSSYMAKFVIEKERMYIENANRASGDGFITPENLEPNPKNPIIAAFFRTIGFADNLGSGTRKLFKYSKYYSGQDPEFKEGDVFRIIVPLDDEYSFDYFLEHASGDRADEKAGDKISNKTSDKTSDKTDDKIKEAVYSSLTANEKKILGVLKENPLITQDEIAGILGLSNSGVRYVMNRLKEKKLITRVGSKKSGGWSVNHG